MSPQHSDSSDEGSLHIDTDTKPTRSAKGKKDSGGSAAGILDLLQASEEVGALDYNPSRSPAAPRLGGGVRLVGVLQSWGARGGAGIGSSWEGHSTLKMGPLGLVPDPGQSRLQGCVGRSLREAGPAGRGAWGGWGCCRQGLCPHKNTMRSTAVHASILFQGSG